MPRGQMVKSFHTKIKCLSSQNVNIENLIKRCFSSCGPDSAYNNCCYSMKVTLQRTASNTHRILEDYLKYFKERTTSKISKCNNQIQPNTIIFNGGTALENSSL